MARIVFMGTAQFSRQILACLLESDHEILAVVSQPDKAQGRSRSKLQKTAVKSFLEEKGSEIPLFQPEKASSKEFIEQIKAMAPDFLVVAAYGQILKQELLDTAKIAPVNVHTSLLPKYRGAAPISQAILNGDTETGVSIMKMVLAMDAGPIYKQKSCPIAPNMNAQELEEELARLSGPVLLEVLESLVNKKIEPQEQDESRVSLAPKISAQTAEIAWENAAQVIHNQVRAMAPEPSAWCWVKIRGEEKRLKIHATELPKVEEPVDATPKTILSWGKQGLIVATGKGALKLTQIQPPGKATMDSKSFCNGCPQDQFELL